jgi:phosphatidylserine decarboxylase precursor-related protein
MCILLIHMFPKFKSVLIGILCVLVYLYRVPNRPSITGDPTRIVSPCDGTVLDIIDLPNGFTQIIIYLSILDVHAQWFPTDGTVHETVYTPGKFNLAHILEKSDYNEKVTTILETPYGQVRINQIAGQVARRIVNWSRPGQVGRNRSTREDSLIIPIKSPLLTQAVLPCRSVSSNFKIQHVYPYGFTRVWK